MPFAEPFGRHTTDNALLAIVAGEALTPHVSSCAPCQERLAELRAWTAGVGADAGALADEAFSADVLAAQKKEILRRLENEGRSARVIAFPLGSPAAVTRPSQLIIRWAAAAAVAGVAIGIGSVRLLDLRSTPAPAVATAEPPRPVTSPAATPVSPHPDDLDEAALLDAAYDRVAVDALRTIDDMTPRAREVARASLSRPRR